MLAQSLAVGPVQLVQEEWQMRAWIITYLIPQAILFTEAEMFMSSESAEWLKVN